MMVGTQIKATAAHSSVLLLHKRTFKKGLQNGKVPIDFVDDCARRG